MIPDDFLNANASGVLKETVYIIVGSLIIGAIGMAIGWAFMAAGWIVT